MKKDVVIIGGGIAGLTNAFKIHRQGYSVLVLESDARPGGAMETFFQNGFW